MNVTPALPLWRSLKNAYHIRLHRRSDRGRQIIFVAHTPLTQVGVAHPGWSVSTYSDISNVPARAARLAFGRGQSARDSAKAMFASDAQWSCGYLDSDPACWMWHRLGATLPQWCVPVSRDDLLVYRVFCRHKYRGRGLSARLIQDACSEAGPDVHRVWCGIAPWNDSSQRLFGKLGFEPFACIEVTSRP